MRESFRTSPASRSQPAEPEQEVLVYQGSQRDTLLGVQAEILGRCRCLLTS